MAGAKPIIKMLYNGCVNCCFYNWKQEEGRSSLQWCAKCKLVFYCSEECQKEHWFNVHKFQCKYLAKLKVYPQSVHDEATCPNCKEEAETGWEEMCRPDNPVLGCPLKNIIISAGLPFPLGEMSGQFLTKTDATLSLMLRILYKMKITRHASWVFDPNSQLKIFNMICMTREQCWMLSNIYGNPGPRLNRAVVSKAYESMKEFDELIMMIGTKLDLLNISELKDFQPWETLELLTSFLNLCLHEQNRNSAELVGLPDLSEDLLSIRVTSAQFNCFWQQILDALHVGMVPFMTLVEVLCGGKLKQACYGCLKEVTVLDATIPKMLVTKIKGPVLVFGNVRAVLCDGPMCEEIKEDISVQDSDLNVVYVRKGFFEGAAFMCDFCGLPGTSGNMGRRCSRCLTKVYCGEKCRDHDWVVHKLVCREGEVERKRKGGQLDRKMKGRDGAEKHFDGLNERSKS